MRNLIVYSFGPQDEGADPWFSSPDPLFTVLWLLTFGMGAEVLFINLEDKYSAQGIILVIATLC